MKRLCVIQLYSVAETSEYSDEGLCGITYAYEVAWTSPDRYNRPCAFTTRLFATHSWFLLSPTPRGDTLRLLEIYSEQYDTRKLCYRKDDRAMRPIHGCHENFRDSLTTPTAIIRNIFHGLLFGSTL